MTQKAEDPSSLLFKRCPSVGSWLLPLPGHREDKANSVVSTPETNSILPSSTGSSIAQRGNPTGLLAMAEASSIAETGAQNKESLHISCKDFIKLDPGRVEKWLRSLKPDVVLKKVFKLKPWPYAFVTVPLEQVEDFKKCVEGVKMKKFCATITQGHARDNNNRRRKENDDNDNDDEDGSGKGKGKGKKPREFPEGYVPTLKDLKESIAKSKGSKDASVKDKTAPLLRWTYEQQVGMKNTYVKSAVRQFTKQIRARTEGEGLNVPDWTSVEWSKASAAPIGCGCPMDEPVSTRAEMLEGYRNKCEFTIGCTFDGNGKVIDGDVDVGFVQRIKDDGEQVVEACDEVPHVPKQMKQLCSTVRDHVKTSPFKVFLRQRGVKTGIWRVIMARMSTAGELMVLLQTASLSDADREKLVQPFLSAILAKEELRIASVYLQFNDAVSDAAPANAPLMHIYGSPRLNASLCGLNFELGPLSFFQTNYDTCKSLYNKAIDWLRPEGALFLDVCCGVGTIGLCAASRCHEVIGVELISEAVKSAKENADINGIKNARFIVGKAEEVLPRILDDLNAEEDRKREVVAIVDPPRGGLHKAVCWALRNCDAVSRMVYISCNPDSLVEDMQKLAWPRENGDAFVPVRAVAVDMFPHTTHVEMILLLERESQVVDPRTKEEGKKILLENPPYAQFGPPGTKRHREPEVEDPSWPPYKKRPSVGSWLMSLPPKRPHDSLVKSQPRSKRRSH